MLACLRFLAVIATSTWLSMDLPAWSGQPADAPGLTGEGWAQIGPAAARLISERDGIDTEAAVNMAIQVRLAPGWWTYWRAPGDSGMPPAFDWQGSSNVKWDPELFWPKPIQRTSLGHTMRIYRDEVAFPLRVVAADPAQPMTLRVNFTMGVCKDVCIPIMAHLSLTLPPRPQGTASILANNRDLIRKYQASVPTADQQLSGIRIENVRLIEGAAKLALGVDVRGLTNEKPPLVLIELSPGDPPEVARSLGRPESPRALWMFSLDTDKSSDSRADLLGQRVRVMVLQGSKSLEQIRVIGAPSNGAGHFGAVAAGRQGSGDPMNPLEDPWNPRE